MMLVLDLVLETLGNLPEKTPEELLEAPRLLRAEGDVAAGQKRDRQWSQRLAHHGLFAVALDPDRRRVRMTREIVRLRESKRCHQRCSGNVNTNIG